VFLYGLIFMKQWITTWIDTKYIERSWCRERRAAGIKDLSRTMKKFVWYLLSKYFYYMGLVFMLHNGVPLDPHRGVSQPRSVLCILLHVNVTSMPTIISQ